MITYEQIKNANDTISTMMIEKVSNKTGEVIKKEYAEVNQRIKAFRMVYPDGFINTLLCSNENGVCVFRAEVGFYAENGNRVLIGSGTAYEKEGSTFINKTSYIENCETSAVGRALGMAGFGIDTSVASAEEVQNAMKNQEPEKKEEPKKEEPKTEEPKKERKASSTQVAILASVYKDDNLTKLLEVNGITKLEDISMQVASSLISRLKERNKK